MSSESRTQKYEFSFPDLKIWVQFYDTKINRHSFCIHATVNIRNSISDVLDLKLWVQIPEFKNMSSVFRTWKMWVQFSGPNFWGRELEKIKGKNQKIFKVPKMSKNVSKCPNVIWGIFLKTFFCPVFNGVIESFRKNQRTFKIAEIPKIVAKIVQTCFEHALRQFFRFFLPCVPCRAFQIFWT